MLCYFLLAAACSTWRTILADDVSTAATLKKIADFDELIDETINPCDDFQGYVCSRLNARFDVKSQTNVDERLKNRVTTGIRPDDQEAVKKFYDFYGKCTTRFDTHNASLHRLLQDLDSVFKDGSGRYLPFDPTLIAKLSAYLFNYHKFSIFIPIRYHKPYLRSSRWFSKNEKILYFNEFEFFQDRMNYDPTILPSQKEWLISAFQAVVATTFPTISASKVNETAEKFFQFEIDISKLLQYPQKDEVEMEKQLQELTVGEAMTKFPEFDWKMYITSFFNYSGIDLLKGEKFKNYPIGIYYPKLVNELPNVVKMVSEDTLRDYIRFRVVFNFYKVFNNESIPGSCQSTAFTIFNLIKQYFYITETLPTPESRFKLIKSLTKVTNDVLASAENMLERVSWIKNDNQTFADKINKLTKVIGFPDNLANQTWLNEQYRDFPLDGADDLYSLYLKTMKFLVKWTFEDERYALPSIDTPNCYYAPSDNKILILLAFVNDIIFHPDYVPAFNYGALGSFVGHEFLHAFDINGRNNDGDGYINPWMSANSKAKFESMAQCLIDEYDKFTVTDSTGILRRINGTTTLAENMSDNGGIRAAYMAFKNNPAHTQSFPRTKKLEKYTQEQLFFLAYARTYCEPREIDVRNIVNSLYPPGKIRALGTLQNFVPFREAFNCPANSVYAPEKHCEVYTPDLDSGVSSLIPSFILLAIMALFNLMQ